VTKKEATRDRYGVILKKLAEKDKNIIVMDCDLGRSTRSYSITEVDKRRFIEMGISEQDMISTAAGLAHEGKIVFANSFAVFIVGRAFDQIRQQLALANLNVKVCGSSAGLTEGPDGATHQSIVDVSLMRSLPNMVVMVPADGPQTEAAVIAAYKHKGPVYLRLSRYDIENIYSEEYKYDIYKAVELSGGKNIAFVTCGPILSNVVSAVKALNEKGIDVGVINVPTLKPIDKSSIRNFALKYKKLITVEEHNIFGGLGSAIAEVVSVMEEKEKANICMVGVNDTFGESGTAVELLSKHKLDVISLVNKVIEISK